MTCTRTVCRLAVSAAVLFSPLAAAVLPLANTGNLYVSMWESDDIAVFTPDGTPVTRFTTDGLNGPRGLAFHPGKDELWVSGEFSNAVYVFDTQHQLLRTIEHPDFNEPVGVTFSPSANMDGEQDVLISNSNGNEIMVFDETGNLLRRFNDPSLNDPNCTALFPDGSLFVANRLGGSAQRGGAVSRFDRAGSFEFDFRTDGLSSTMAVARDPNVPGDTADDTLWVTSGAGMRGIHEFDVSGNLLRSILPGDLPEGQDIVPQGIAVADNGHLYVVSFNNEVFEFDGEGNFLSRFPTGDGTSRSTAFQRCDDSCADETGRGSGKSSGGIGCGAFWLLLTGFVVRSWRGRARIGAVRIS